MKRLYENHFVHLHANKPKAISELYIDCFYYWGFSIWIGYSVNSGKQCHGMHRCARSGPPGVRFWKSARGDGEGSCQLYKIMNFLSMEGG